MSTESIELKNLDSHFEFGNNWALYAENINEERIESAKVSLIKLFGKDGLKDKTFLDIGCGSGLFSLSAILLGARKVMSIDIDPMSVATTKKVLSKYATHDNFHVAKVSVFDLKNYLKTNTELDKEFDIVYSWGVLHHTGSMFEAISEAKDRMSDNGLFCVALYYKTRLCKFWTIEKKIYTKLPRICKNIIVYIFMALFLMAKLIVKRENIFKFLKTYKSQRGMSFYHDVVDWVGGYPYESISASEFNKWANLNSFTVIKEFVSPNKDIPLGVFGSGCNEYVIKKK